MSYNIDSVRYIEGGPLRIKRKDARELVGELNKSRRRAEITFLDSLNLSNQLDQEAWLNITQPTWNGEFSGNTYNVLLNEVLPRTAGSAVLHFTWEGGDSHTALKVTDGKVEEKTIKMSVE